MGVGVQGQVTRLWALLWRPWLMGWWPPSLVLALVRSRVLALIQGHTTDHSSPRLWRTRSPGRSWS